MLTTYRPTLFVPIEYHPRIGKSKIKPVRDTLRFVSLILRTGTYFALVRTFAAIILGLFSLGIASLACDTIIIAISRTRRFSCSYSPSISVCFLSLRI